jgi:hypothetical protein
MGVVWPDPLIDLVERLGRKLGKQRGKRKLSISATLVAGVIMLAEKLNEEVPPGTEMVGQKRLGRPPKT